MQQNPLLTDSQFIPFGTFSILNLGEALKHYLNQAAEIVSKVETISHSSWNNIIDPIHNALYKLNHVWGLCEHLLAVNDTQELRDLHQEFQPIITQFYINLSQNHKIYQHYLQIKNTPNEYNNLNKIQKKVLENEFRDFFLNGIELNKEQQIQFKEIQTKLNSLSTKFEQNILDATDSFSTFVTIEQLDGVPNDAIQMYKTQAIEAGKPELYKITLHMPSYLPILQYATNRKLREELYYHFVTRASEFDNKGRDNSELIIQILSLRHKKATMLKFKTYTELSLYTKMATNAQEITNLLNMLSTKSKGSAQADLAELTQFAQNLDNLDHLAAWDILYYSEKLQQQKYNYSNEELKQYFQLPIVLNGLFSLIKSLYNVEFIENKTIPTWNSTIQVFDVSKNNKPVGTLYLDLFARNGKRSGAWMNSAQDKFTNSENKTFYPQTYVICNFTPPIEDKTCLLTFDEVQTLFHEMGHALHHLLTQITHFAISGMNGVEWDAVELPSQFMEYFTWNYKIITTLTQHITDHNTLPLELYQKILNARFFQSGLQMLRQIEFALFDISLHNTHITITSKTQYLQILDDIRQQVAAVFPPSYNRFPNTFSHIFAGGYASGYYSYKWAEVLAADVFSKFDTLNTEQEYANLGEKFLSTILASGGLNPMLENFIAFMGRSPELDAILKYSGIK